MRIPPNTKIRLIILIWNIIGLEETQVEKLGNAVYMLIRDNPKMFERSKLSGETDD